MPKSRKGKTRKVRTVQHERCKASVCKRKIKTQIYKGTGHCSDLCRKLIAEEITVEQWRNDRRRLVQHQEYTDRMEIGTAAHQLVEKLGPPTAAEDDFIEAISTGKVVRDIGNGVTVTADWLGSTKGLKAGSITLDEAEELERQGKGAIVRKSNPLDTPKLTGYGEGAL